MKRITILAAAMFLFLLPASAQDWAKQVLDKSTRHGEWVNIKHDARTVAAYVVYPEIKTKAPVIIVIHEIFGASDWSRTVADQLAAAGYIAIAPDLLSEFGPNKGGSSAFPDLQATTRAIGQLDPDVITADLNAVAEYAKKIPAANGKLAVSGFCWGGSQTFRFATNRTDISAAFVFYGTAPAATPAVPAATPAPATAPAAGAAPAASAPPPPRTFNVAADIAKIKAPVYGFYAENDARIGATIAFTKDAMDKAGKKYDPVTYTGAGHGFMRLGMDPTQDATKNAPNVTARDDAWKRWLELLKKM